MTSTALLDVLIVDDSAAIRKILQRVLRQTDLPLGEIKEAGDGAEAVTILQDRTFGLILSDINMPNMDGIEFTRRLRAMPEYKWVPIVLLTTESHPEKKQEGKAAGATGWIVKPFNAEQLLATVKKVIR